MEASAFVPYKSILNQITSSPTPKWSPDKSLPQQSPPDPVSPYNGNTEVDNISYHSETNNPISDQRFKRLSKQLQRL